MFVDNFVIVIASYHVHEQSICYISSTDVAYFSSTGITTRAQYMPSSMILSTGTLVAFTTTTGTLLIHINNLVFITTYRFYP